MNERAGAPCGMALHDYARAELEAAITRLSWRSGRLHAGVHLARKALRRARATLALGPGALGPGAALLDRELHRSNGGLSSLRDAQALVETLDRQLAVAHDDETMGLLRRVRRAAASVRVATAREVQMCDPGLAERKAMLRVLCAAMAALPWASLSPSQLRDMLARSQARMQQAQQRAIVSGRDEDWHRWRKRARRWSQQQRALKTSGLEIDLALDKSSPTTTKRWACCAASAALLGTAQDLSLLLQHCGRRSVFSKPDRHALRRFAAPALVRLRQRLTRAARHS